jgi:hypothetical protein
VVEERRGRLGLADSAAAVSCSLLGAGGSASRLTAHQNAMGSTAAPARTPPVAAWGSGRGVRPIWWFSTEQVPAVCWMRRAIR